MTLAFKSFDAQTELSAQRSLFRASFPETVNQPPSTETYYNWKFHSFPFNPHSYEYSAYSDDSQRMVGYYAAIPFQYKIDDQILTCGMVCDVMTCPSMRGKGVFTALGRYSLSQLTCSGVHFVLGYPIRPEVIPGHIKVGWKIAFELPMFIFPLKTQALLSTKKLGWLSGIADIFALFYRGIVSALNPRDKNINSTIHSVDEFLQGSEFACYIEKWQKKTPNALLKSRPFLRWRLSSPGSHYQIIATRFGDEIQSIAIVRSASLQGVPSLAIVDWMVVNPSSPLMRSAVHTMQEQAQNQNCQVIVGMMSRHLHKVYGLLRQGFIPSPAVFKLIVNPLGMPPDSPTAQALFDENRWSLMWIDTDDL